MRRSHNVKQANRQSINITFAQPRQRRRHPSQLKQLGRQLETAAEELDTVKDRAAASGYRFNPKIPDIDATSAAGAKRLIAQVREATARGQRLVRIGRQGRHGIAGGGLGEALPRRVDEEGFLADPIPRPLDEAQAPELVAAEGGAEWAEEAQAQALQAGVGDAEWADEAQAPTLRAAEGGAESMAEDNSELEQTREHVRELLGMSQELVSAVPPPLERSSASESSAANQDLEDAQADVSELLKIATHMSTGHTAALVPGSSSESSLEVQDPEIAEMLAEMHELQSIAAGMAGSVEVGKRLLDGTLGDPPVDEAPVGVLMFGAEVLMLPDVTQSHSSREFKEAGREFLTIRRKINGASITPAESRLMIHSLERYRQDIRNTSRGANDTSKDLLRRLDSNVVSTIVALGG
jgi:hypothetical protein